MSTWDIWGTEDIVNLQDLLEEASIQAKAREDALTLCFFTSHYGHF